MQYMIPSKIRKNGGSTIVGIPAEIVDLVQVGVGQRVTVTATEGEKEIRILLE